MIISFLKCAHSSSETQLDGRQKNSTERKEVEDVYHVDARGGGGLSSVKG